MQEPFFFRRGEHKLFGMYFSPEHPFKDTGVVLCNGYGKEYPIIRSPLVGFARELARHGFACLRFDYAGYGDSEGEFADATITSMCDDIETAIEQLKIKSGVKHVGLLGTRFGSTLATLVAARRPDTSHLILWEPVLQPWDYLFSELRQTVAMQTIMFRKVLFTREQIVENLLASRPSLSDGYDFNCIDEGFPLGKGLVLEAKETDLLKALPALKTKTLLVHVRKNNGAIPKKLGAFVDALTEQGATCQTEVAIEPTLFWKHEKEYAVRCPDVYAKTLTWLEGM
ncbi:MAG: alpha/beta fold hydrolase [Pseudomonadota bacterium]